MVAISRAIRSADDVASQVPKNEAKVDATSACCASGEHSRHAVMGGIRVVLGWWGYARGEKPARGMHKRGCNLFLRGSNRNDVIERPTRT
jgi:hypothetical protein